MILAVFFCQAIVAQVKSLLDSASSDSCPRVSEGCRCGDDARGFYRAFQHRADLSIGGYFKP